MVFVEVQFVRIAFIEVLFVGKVFVFSRILAHITTESYYIAYCYFCAHCVLDTHTDTHSCFTFDSNYIRTCMNIFC